ncbi:MAG: gamma-glutamyltransferase, partial [SAR202 cluster bacterium]|nr:gamma-glutamyltransferase [SAR202 cluster bacterium]
TLRSIAREGDGVLYGGRLGEEVAEDMAQNGGLVTLEDLTSYEVRERKPVRGAYRGHEVVSMGPTSSGGVHIIQALNLLEGFDVKRMGYGSVEYFHLLLEALKVCWADRFAFLGDPEQVPVPVEELTSKEYAEKRRGELDMERARAYKAGDLAPVESANTTHLTVADSEGNVVTMTHTLNDAFGSRVMVPGMGMLMNNCMALFDPHAGRPNSVGSGKRMVSSMSPSIIFKDGKPWFALGTPGGIRIFASVLQGIVNVIDHGMSLQEAVEAPRIWTQGGVVEVESGVPEPVREGLRRRGHKVSVVEKVAGGMNGVMFGEDGMIQGVACWRADGSPAGFSGGPARGGGGY